MPNPPPPPPGFIPDPPPGFTVDPSGASASVFDKPTVGQRLKRIGKAVAAPVAGMATAVGGEEAGAALGTLAAPGPGTLIGAGVGSLVGGGAQPFVERGVQSAVTGQPYQNPTAHEVILSAVTNAAFTGLAKGGEALTKSAQVEDKVSNELAKLPQAQRTVANIRKIRDAVQSQAEKGTAEAAKVTEQDLRNRDFWKAHGLSDQQIDEVIKSPDLQSQLASSINAASKYKDAFQTVIDHQRADFKARYDAAMGEAANYRFNAEPIGQKFEQAAQGAGEHEISPAFRGFLQRKGLQITRPSDFPVNGPEISGVPWRQLRPEVQRKYIGQGVLGEQAKIALEQSQTLSVNELRQLRTELRENLPSAPTNLDRKTFNDLNTSLSNEIDSKLAEGGARPENIAAMHAVDDEYGRFQDTLKKLDPRSGKFGDQIADLLFDKQLKNPEQALNFMNMAKAAEQANPGQVMPQLREAFLNKALTETRKPGEPFQELKALRQLQDQFGGDANSRAVMGELFGKDSPLANPATFTKVVEAASTPESVVLKTSPSQMRTILSSPYFQGMITFGVLAGLSGTKGGGVFSALTGEKGTAAQMMAISAMLAGPPLIGWVVKSGNSPLQRAMVSYLSSPNAATAIRYAGEISGAATSAALTGQSQLPPGLPPPPWSAP